ncbi:LysR substrate-binding domain-containing protein [Alicyclobacillus fodiniaquatilis]|uniref:LysR substrate-binding domain-containing protein n=1 Tax=Alicyclobacillus fodiniaquatilis TaxID=1661150 RepID=A0ABW4JH70_9BACL
MPISSTVRAVMSGYGANFVSSLVVRDAVRRGELARVFVEDVQLQNTIAIFVRKHERLSTAAYNFIEVMKEADRQADGHV